MNGREAVAGGRPCATGRARQRGGAAASPGACVFGLVIHALKTHATRMTMRREAHLGEREKNP
jgi:hypothetical protein